MDEERRDWRGEEWIGQETVVVARDLRSVALIRSDRREWVWLRGVVEHTRGFRVLGEVRQVKVALEMAGSMRPDIVLVASELVAGVGSSFAGELRRSSPQSGIVVLGDFQCGESIIDLCAAGMDSYLEWDDLDAAKVRAALVAADAGLRCGTKRVVGAVLVLAERRRRSRELRVVLTDHEREVLRGLAAGLKEREIARGANVSVRTVEDTVARLKGKLRRPTVAALVAQAVADHLL